MSRKIKSFVMDLWISWWNIVCLLRPAFSRARTFLWFLLVLAAFSVRNDLLGVSSFVRALGLSEHFYEHLLHFFHSNAVKTDRLAELWFAIVIKHFPVYKIGCRPVLVLDGIKKSKEGRKMPAVKYLHQQSESNSKPHFIMSHSFQAFGVLCQVGGYFFCVPVCARIHEGIVTSNRDRRTLIDKANEMLASVCRGQEFVLLADAYYANGKVIRSTKGRSGVLVTRVRRTTTGFRPAAVPRKRKRGRPKKYGAAVKLQNVFGTGGFSSVPSPVYGERKHLCPVQVGGSVVEARRGDGPLHSRRSSHERADHPLVYRPHHGSSGDHLALQFAFQDRSRFQASGAFGRLIRIPFLDGRYATAQASQW